MVTGLAATVAAANLAVAVVNTRTVRLAQKSAVPCRVRVLIPVRDEADRIVDLLADLRGQHGLADIRFHLFDDDSTDSTARLISDVESVDQRFEVISSRAGPPPGWTGKNYALHRLSTAVLTDCDDDTVLIFLDADVRLESSAIATAVSAFTADKACSRRLGLLSVWPAQESADPLGTLIQPLLMWSWMAWLPIRFSERLSARSMAVAVGQFMVTDAGCYRAMGGHAAIRDAIVDDLALARSMREAGYTTAVRTTAGLVRCRMYDTGGQTWRGHRRWLVYSFGSPITACGAAAVAAAAYIAPVAMIALPGRRLPAIAIYTCTVITRIISRRTETSQLHAADIGSAIAHPISVALTIGILGDALRTPQVFWRGRLVSASINGPTRPSRAVAIPRWSRGRS